eukprot:1161515-Pelagomonas_calceolata.AAC.11
MCGSKHSGSSASHRSKAEMKDAGAGAPTDRSGQMDTAISYDEEVEAVGAGQIYSDRSISRRCSSRSKAVLAGCVCWMQKMHWGRCIKTHQSAVGRQGCKVWLAHIIDFCNGWPALHQFSNSCKA